MHTTNAHSVTVLKSKGFTLIELLVSLVLIATLLFFSLPITSTIHKKNKIQSIQNDIKAAIRFAKTQALVTGQNVILKPLHNSKSWSDGIQLQYASDDKPFHEWRWHSSGIQVTWHGFQSSHYLLFSVDAGRNTVNGTFEIDHVELVLNRLGRVRE